MDQTVGPYRVVDFPAARQGVLNFLDLSSLARYMFGLLEVDVTIARRFIEEHKARTGEALSFTGYLTFCLARAVAEDTAVQAYRKGRDQLVIFDDVDVGMMIERQVGETRAPTGYTVRRANHKTFMEIHQEIRAVQAAPLPAPGKAPLWIRLRPLLPEPLQKLLAASIRASIRRDPAGKWVAMAGTVAVTAVGMFGNRGGWGVADPSGHTLCLIVGGIGRKPAVVGDRVEPREMLNLTVAFNHHVVDGAPAARFSRKLVELIESGYGLEQDGGV